MKRLTIVFVVLLCTMAYAREKDPCRYVGEKMDAFGTTKEGFFKANLYQGEGIGIHKENGTYRLEVRYFSKEVVDVTIEAGTIALLALENGIKLELKADKKSVPKKDVNPGGAFTNWTVNYPLTKSDLKVLSESHVKAIKTVPESTEIVFILATKSLKKMLNGVATCFYNREG